MKQQQRNEDMLHLFIDLFIYLFIHSSLVDTGNPTSNINYRVTYFRH